MLGSGVGGKHCAVLVATDSNFVADESQQQQGQTSNTCLNIRAKPQNSDQSPGGRTRSRASGSWQHTVFDSPCCYYYYYYHYYYYYYYYHYYNFYYNFYYYYYYYNFYYYYYNSYYKLYYNFYYNFYYYYYYNFYYYYYPQPQPCSS